MNVEICQMLFLYLLKCSYGLKNIYSINVINYIDFSDVKSIFIHSWDKSHLAMMHLLDSTCLNFVKDFFICLHERY